MRHLVFVYFTEDTYVWMRREQNSDGSSYYDYALLYTNDVLAISDNVYKIIREGIGLYFKLKYESVGPPNIYLEDFVQKVDIVNGAIYW